MSLDAIAPAVRRRIDRELDAIESEHGVRILFAVESGSRAWGFPSPDSDYDVRFIYARPLDWYLSIRRRRDVIERPITDVLDVNGWDIAKALALLGRGNPGLLEWLASPIVYRSDAETVAALSGLADRVPTRPTATFHYRALASRRFEASGAGHAGVPLKRLLYALRSAAALRWLRTHRHGRVPMALPALLADIALPDAMRAEIADLLAHKAMTMEQGEGPSPPLPSLDAFIREEIDAAGTEVPGPPEAPPTLAGEVDRLFRRLIRRGDAAASATLGAAWVV